MQKVRVTQGAKGGAGRIRKAKTRVSRTKETQAEQERAKGEEAAAAEEEEKEEEEAATEAEAEAGAAAKEQARIKAEVACMLNTMHQLMQQTRLLRRSPTPRTAQCTGMLMLKVVA